MEIYSFLGPGKIGGVHDATPKTLSNQRSTPQNFGPKEWTNQLLSFWHPQIQYIHCGMSHPIKTLKYSLVLRSTWFLLPTTLRTAQGFNQVFYAKEVSKYWVVVQLTLWELVEFISILRCVKQHWYFPCFWQLSTQSLKVKYLTNSCRFYCCWLFEATSY